MRRTCLQSILMALLLVAVPVCAQAWTLTVKVTGGSLTPANTVVLTGGTAKTIANGNTTVYPSAATTVSVNTAAGFTSSITLDGMSTASTSFSLSSGSHTVTVAYSAPQAANLAITQSAGGAAYVLLPSNTWSATGATGLKVGTPLPYSISADSAHVIKAYTVNGIRQAVDGTVSGQNIQGTLVPVAGANTISAEYGIFASVTGSLSTPTDGFTSQPVNATITASSNDTGLSYSFTVTGPTAFFRDWSPVQTFSFTPVQPGTYSVSASVKTDNGGSFSAPAVKIVVADNQTHLNSTCVSCHSTQSPAIVASYQASPLHNQSPAATCESCHTATAPHSSNINALNVDAATFQVLTPDVAGMAQGSSFCIKCHDVSIDPTFAASQHKANALTCASCHTNGVHNVQFTAAPVRPYAGDSYLNHELASSNICMSCHSGTNNGASIAAKAALSDFSNLAFVAPGSSAPGGVLDGKAGYRFPKQQPYGSYSSNFHVTVGMLNANGTGTGGPCVGCHMTSSAKHSFEVVTTNASGAVTGLLASACAQCHGSSANAVQLAADNQAAFATGLKILNAALADKGFSSTAAAPYFKATNWGSGQAGANVMGAAYNYQMLVSEPGAYAHNPDYVKQLIVDSIDAVYNNGTLTGSIDAALLHLQGAGAITQADIDSLTKYKAGTGCTSCHNANTGSHTAHLSANPAVSCSACHYATAATNNTLVPGTTKHANGVVDVVINGGGSYSGGLAGTCTNVVCHSDGMGNYGSVVWGSGKLTCVSCHPVLAGAHSAHIGNLMTSNAFATYTGNYSTASSYRFGCANCHPADMSGHQDGTITLTLVNDPSAGSLRGKNSAVVSGINNSGSGITGTTKVKVVCSAAYCHSNGMSSDQLVFANSPDWYNPGAYTGDRCAMCHGNSPNSTIPGSAAHTVHTVGIHSLNVYSGGFGNLTTGKTGNVGHGIAAQSTTLSCNVCHNDTVNSARDAASTSCSGCHTPASGLAQIANKAMHVNGRVDVVFANMTVVSKAQLRPASFAAYSAGIWTRNGGNYKNGAAAYDVSKTTLKHAAVFDGGNCSNVACHMGKPVDWTNTNSPSYCALCHTAL